MSGENPVIASGATDTARFDELAGVSKPYRGGIKEPATELEQLVLSVLSNYGNDVVPLPTDPYERTPMKLDPTVRTLDADGRQEFGANYMTYRTPLRWLGAASILFVYHKQYGRAEVTIDDFKTQHGGGLASRTTLTSWEEKPEVVYKKRQTDFTSYMGQVGIGDFIDFSRELTGSEKKTLEGVFSDPGMLHQRQAGRSLRQRELIDEFTILVGESDKEAEVKEKNRKEFGARMNEHRKNMEAIARSHVLILPKKT